SSEKSLIMKMVPNVSKAAVWGIFTYMIVSYLPTLLFPIDFLPFGYNQFFDLFVGIAVFFAVITNLFSGTIFGYAFSIARGLVMIIYFIVAFNGGIISLTMPMLEVTVNLVVDVKAFLAILVLINLLGIGKSLLQITNFLAKKVESSQLSMH
ncbi:MAG: hypothetical protein NWE87_06200, partial [Candidatus Bathyarchaeota archaeon]|nr:hypothetical protein [Candidatus Bathyarchaeota archaeon]